MFIYFKRYLQKTCILYIVILILLFSISKLYTQPNYLDYTINKYLPQYPQISNFNVQKQYITINGKSYSYLFLKVKKPKFLFTSDIHNKISFIYQLEETFLKYKQEGFTPIHITLGDIIETDMLGNRALSTIMLLNTMQTFVIPGNHEFDQLSPEAQTPTQQKIQYFEKFMTNDFNYQNKNTQYPQLLYFSTICTIKIMNQKYQNFF